eukprot:122023-Chlamydomonas_euryale.AAC.1
MEAARAALLSPPDDLPAADAMAALRARADSECECAQLVEWTRGRGGGGGPGQEGPGPAVVLTWQPRWPELCSRVEAAVSGCLATLSSCSRASVRQANTATLSARAAAA